LSAGQDKDQAAAIVAVSEKLRALREASANTLVITPQGAVDIPVQTVDVVVDLLFMTQA
jgi:hypothetical protein